MLFLFKNNTKKDRVKQDYIKGKLWQRFDETNRRLQFKCAQWLECKTAHLSRKSWIVILFLFTIVASGYNIYLIVEHFSQNTATIIAITPIAKPANFEQISYATDKLKVPINKVEYEKMVRFRRYMDSLGRSPTGKKMQDSITRYRPGLLDSLVIVENYYH